MLLFLSGGKGYICTSSSAPSPDASSSVKLSLVARASELGPPGHEERELMQLSM
jgi:hypothetical protein